jgi:hypothetical protein
VCVGRAPAQAMAVASASRTTGVSVLTPVLSVLGAIRTHTAQRLMLEAPAVGATRTRSRHPVPTRAICRTKAGPQPCAAA